MKKCPKCREEKAGHEFTTSTFTKCGLQSWCKECNRIMERARHESRKSYNRDDLLRSEYGVSLDEYNEILTEQNGVCWICQKATTKMCLDHCHETGEIRGILCNKCNIGLGHFQDDIALLERALEYMKKPKRVRSFGHILKGL